MSDVPKEIKKPKVEQPENNGNHSWNIYKEVKNRDDTQPLLDKSEPREQGRIEKFMNFSDGRKQEKADAVEQRNFIKDELRERTNPIVEKLSDDPFIQMQKGETESNAKKEAIREVRDDYVSHISRVGRLKTSEGREQFKKDPSRVYNDAAFSLKVAYRDENKSEIIDLLKEELNQRSSIAIPDKPPASVSFYNQDAFSTTSFDAALQPGSTEKKPYYSPLDD